MSIHQQHQHNLGCWLLADQLLMDYSGNLTRTG